MVLPVGPAAQVKEGEVVLVHAGASGVGTAAVQLARLFGAVPVVTAGGPEKLKLAGRLGAAAGFNYKEGSFARGVHDFTGGESRKEITRELLRFLSLFHHYYDAFALLFLVQNGSAMWPASFAPFAPVFC